MLTEFSAEQLYVGNPRREQGYSVLACSLGADNRRQDFDKYAVLGHPADDASLWRNTKTFDSYGMFWVENELIFTYIQKVTFPSGHQAELRQHIVLNHKNAVDLHGDWQSVIDHFILNLGNVAMEELSSKQLLPPLSIVPWEGENAYTKSFDALKRWFPPPKERLLPSLLQTLFENKGAICISGLPDSHEDRLDFLRALSALLPLPLRSVCTFATRLISSQNCLAHYKCLRDGQLPRSDEQVFDCNKGEFEISNQVMPYFEKALAAYRGGKESLRDFLQKWEMRSHELQVYFMKQNGDRCSFCEAARQTLESLTQWIDVDASPTASPLLELALKDPSLTNNSSQEYYLRALHLVIDEYSPERSFPPETISCSADLLRKSSLHQTAALELLEGCCDKQPDAVLELCCAWCAQPAAQTILMNENWQSLILKATRQHVEQLRKQSRLDNALNLLSGVVRIGESNNDFTFDQKTVLELLKLQEELLRGSSGHNQHALDTFHRSVSLRSPRGLDELLDPEWSRLLPAKLAAVFLSRHSETTDLSRIVTSFFKVNGEVSFYKLALLCMKRANYSPLLGFESISRLTDTASMVKDRTVDSFMDLANYSDSDYPNIAGVIVNSLCDLSNLAELLSSNSQTHLLLTAWLIRHEDPRTGSFLEVLKQRLDIPTIVRGLFDNNIPDQRWAPLTRHFPSVTAKTPPNERLDIAILREMPVDRWNSMPEVVKQFSEHLVTWDSSPEALDQEVMKPDLYTKLRQWYRDRTRQDPNDPTAISGAKRVYAPDLRAIRVSLEAKRPDTKRAVYKLAALCEQFPFDSPLGQWIVETVWTMVDTIQMSTKEFSVFVNQLQRKKLSKVAQKLLMHALDRQILPSDLTPSNLCERLAVTFQTLDLLNRWQIAMDRDRDLALQVLNDWFEPETESVAIASRLMERFSPDVFDDNLDNVLSTVDKLVKTAQQDGYRLFEPRKRQLTALQKREREPSSVFSLLLNWIYEMASPQAQTDVHDTEGA